MALILLAAWLLSLLIVILQRKMKTATNLAISLVWAGIFFLFAAIIIISLPLTFLSNKPDRDRNH